MDRRDYQASCAVCQGPADPDCASGCESARLNMCIAQAETQWLETWREKTREWVANHAIRYVTNTFQQMKEARLANHNAYIKALPYWDIYEQYQGRPPLHPHHINELRRRIRDADEDLRRSIDADWRQCVIRYPEVLTHYFSMVSINMPKDASAPTNLISAPPTFLPQAKPPLERARSTTGTNASKKSRRNSKSIPAKGDFSIEAITKLLQDSGLQGGSNSNHQPNGFSGLGGVGGLRGGGALSGMPSAGFNGLPTGLTNGGYFDKQPGLGDMGGLSGLSGLNSLAALNSLGGQPGLSRTTSKAGRTTPVQEGPPTRPGGKKRHSKMEDYLSAAGRATAPLQHAPFAPPGWSNSRYPM